MIQKELYEKHKVLFTACKQGSSEVVKNYLKENAGSIHRDGVAYEAACVFAKHDKIDVYKQLIQFDEPCIHAARSANRHGKLSPDNECLKLSNIEVNKYNRNLKISDAFENFKIMGQLALGLTALATVEIIKVGATLISEFGLSNAASQMLKLRDKAFSDKTNTNKPDF